MAPAQGKAQGGAPTQNRARPAPEVQKQAAAKPEIRNPAARTRQPQQQRPAQGQAKAEPKHPGGISPRSKRLIASLSELLDPYNYGEPEIHSLIKRCNFDDERIQTAVLAIIEEQDSWGQTATASERKEKKAEATERRLKLEKEQADELERVRQERSKAEDEKLRRAREEAAKRRSQEEAEKKRAADGVKTMGRNSAGAACAWKATDADEADKAGDELTETWTNGGLNDEASPAEHDDLNDHAHKEESWDAPQQEDESWEAPVDSSPVTVDAVVADPPEKAAPSTASAETWGQPPPVAAEPWPSDVNHWSPPTPAPEHSIPAPVATPSPAVASYGEGRGESEEKAVLMPAAYAAFFDSYPAPRVMFGSFNVHGHR